MHKTIFTFALLLTAATAAAAQSPATGQRLGHDYVDLGLSVMWATCNIGASSPSDYGDYFAWGEAETKSSYTVSNSATYGKSSYTFLDAASVQWGSAWRMPTKAECQELINNCTWQWTTVGGHKGYRLTSKENGNTIFLPAAGYRNDTQLNFVDERVCCWSSSLINSNSYAAYNLYFDSSFHRVDAHYRYIGLSIRPVTE